MAKAIVNRCPADADFIQQAIEKSQEGLKPLGALASELDCPLWVMLIPNMPANVLSGENRAKLVKLVNTYLDRLRGQPKPHPVVERWNALRYELFGPISMVATVRESINYEEDYHRWRVLGDAVEEFESLTGKIEKMAYETALGV